MEGIFSSFKPILQKYRFEAAFICIALIIAVVSCLIFISGQKLPEKSDLPVLIKKPLKTPPPNIQIDLSGSVEKPDVYEVSSGARLKDILILAGGLSQDADRVFFGKNFNLAKVLQDQEKIYIPNYEETRPGSDYTADLTVQTDGTSVLGAPDKVNINNASIELLDTLPGIGEVTAKKIIQSRPYQNLEDLITKKALGKAIFEKIKDLIQL